mmetsp:Transcript_16472/g.39786  ORF Transcript_16472/g.39786 Transcript_16472/m.39786 type:complete len:173 (-) Transcript_16472:87-605(-)
MVLLRTSSRVALRLGRRCAADAVVPAKETFAQKTFRWLDVAGFLTRWYSRKAWIQDLEPVMRMGGMMISEWERKLHLWSNMMHLFFTPFSLWYGWGQFTHMAHKPPVALCPEYAHVNERKQDFNFHGGFYHVCKECRWLEHECKKMCYDKLRDEGKNQWGLRRPRTQTIGGH